MRRPGHLLGGVCGLISRWSHQQPLREQRVPAWDRTVRREVNGAVTERLEQAILDIEYQDVDGRRWVDVSVRDPAAGNASELKAAARRDGEAARRGERAKHTRYPGDRLTAFVWLRTGLRTPR